MTVTFKEVLHNYLRVVQIKVPEHSFWYLCFIHLFSLKPLIPLSSKMAASKFTNFVFLIANLTYMPLRWQHDKYIRAFKVPMKWKIILLIWKAFQNTEEWRFSFWNIFFRFRDIVIFRLCKLDQWWRHPVCN